MRAVSIRLPRPPEEPGSIAACRSSPTCAPGEGVSALLLAANVFYLLAFYSVLKIVRDALILSEAGAVAASYAVGRPGAAAARRSCPPTARSPRA